jgi:uncharacterized protein
MHVVIPGGHGQLGRVIAGAMRRRGHCVTVLSRQAAPDPKPRPGGIAHWDGKNQGPWVRLIDGADVVIPLAGRSVNCRYHAANREEIIRSRVDSVHAVGHAMATVARPPKLWLQASTATIYSHRFDQANDELHGQIGGSEPNLPDTWKFSIEVARRWEEAATEHAGRVQRQVLMRMAMVMSPDQGGVFDVLMGLVRQGLGGKQGSGDQYVSWIHEYDFINAIQWLVDDERLSGAVNLASPEPLPNVDFMESLRSAAGWRWGLPATEWMLEVGARWMRTETELVLKSRRVIPTRLLQAGFQFQLPRWTSAAKELANRWRVARESNGGRALKPLATPSAASR